MKGVSGQNIAEKLYEKVSYNNTGGFDIIGDNLHKELKDLLYVSCK